MKVLAVIGARPQFIKHAAIDLAFRKHPDVQLITAHTGQHYDARMSEVFFKELKMTRPDIMLQVGSGSHGRQTAMMMMELEKVMEEQRPDSVLVYGDTNSTLAGALVASKMNIPIAHVEAGLRSFNKSMPEEINRVLTDHMSTLLFAPSEAAMIQLKQESVSAACYQVGDVMYDMIKLIQPHIKSFTRPPYYLATIHRPYNTDDVSRLVEILTALNNLDREVVFPAHPRTLSVLQKHEVDIERFNNIRLLPPQSYIEMMELLQQAKALITDSGGMQKEAYWMQKKCITLRSETEWVETLENGWNTLVFDDLRVLTSELQKRPGAYCADVYGSGNAADSIVEIMIKQLAI